MASSKQLQDAVKRVHDAVQHEKVEVDAIIHPKPHSVYPVIWMALSAPSQIMHWFSGKP